MCGIAGIAGAGFDDHQALSRMLECLAHRGPDDEDLVAAHGASLGHRRLSIIDLEGGRQPISNEDKSLWIVCNGEIYNYRELRRHLIERGHSFDTQSDTEVIVHLYEEYGEECLNKLRGMFAFVIWDKKNKTIFAGRDHLGQKPFFYYFDGSRLIFASEIKAILSHPAVSRAINPHGLHQYFSLRVIGAPITMHQSISKLPPAHYLKWRLGCDMKIHRYWDLSYEPKNADTEDEALDRVEAAIVEAVRLHLTGDVPVGAFLSGGLDSTLIVAIAAKHCGAKGMPTFSIGLPFGEFDESPFARLVAERYGSNHHEAVLVPSLAKHLPELIYHLDEPSDPLSVCSYLVSRMAAGHVKVVLGGDGGDELFGGYDRYYGNLYAGYCALLPAIVRRRFIEPLIEAIPDGGWYKSKAHQLKWLSQASFLEGGERYAQSLGYFYFSPSLRDRVYGPELLRASKEFDAYEAIKQAYERAPAEHPIDRMLYADSQVRLPDHSVMILDRTAMAFGLEARSPFLDHHLAELVARLPVSLKIRFRTLRYIQRRLCERYVPESLLKRPKQGFSSALPYLLGKEYKHLFGVFLKRSQLARDGYLLQAGVDMLLDEHTSRRADHGNRLWLLVNAEAWYRMCVLGSTPDEVRSMIGCES